MKQLLVSFFLLTMSLSMAMAQEVETQEDENDGVTVTLTDNASSAEIEAPDGKVVVVKMDEDEIRDVQVKVQKVVGVVRGLFGEEAANELLDEIRAEIEGELEDGKIEIDGGDEGDHHGHRGNFDDHIPWFVGPVAIIAVILALGTPAIILALVFYFSYRKRRQKLDLVKSYLDADQPVPENILSDFDSGAGSNGPLRSGLTLIAIGLGFAIAFSALAHPGVGALGLIPLFMGIARIAYWKQTQNLNDSISV